MDQKPAPRPHGKYTTFRRFAYTERGDVFPSQTLWQAVFPATWESELDALRNYISQNDRSWHLPYRSLGKVLLLTIPSGVTPGFDSMRSNNQYFRAFITAGEIPPEIEAMTIMIRGWANFEIGGLTKFGSVSYAEIHSRLNELLNKMSPSDLKFESLKVELPLDPSGVGVASENAPYYFLALPAWAAKQLDGKEFEIKDRNFRMIRAQRPDGRGIELVSWPPEPIGKGYLSLVLSFDVQTLPGKANHPMLYPKLHVRRWVHRSLYGKNRSSLLPATQSTTVMVRTTVPWLPNMAVDAQALASTGIQSQRKENGIYAPAWDDNLPALLNTIGATPLPTAEEFADSPTRFYETPEMSCMLNSKILSQIGSPIGSGLFPGDLMSLTEQVDAYLQSLGLARVADDDLDKISLARTNRNKKPISSDNIWQSLKIALGRQKRIRFEIFYQSIQTAQEIWLEFLDKFCVESAEGLDPFTPGGIEVKNADGISIFFRVVLNEYLSVETREEEDLSTAQLELINRVKAEQGEMASEEIGLSIIELTNYYNLKKRHDQSKDAKRTLRYAFAQIGRLTHFIEPVDTSGDEEEKEKAKALIATKSRATVLDARRHLGFLGNDLTEMLDNADLPPGTQLIGLHLEVQNVSRRSKYLNEKAVFFPCAVKLTIGQQEILAIAPDAQGRVDNIHWEPYYQTELRVGTYTGSQLHLFLKDRNKQGGPILEQFVHNIVELEKDKPTVIFVAANSWRPYWTWLQDKRIVFDQMKLNNVCYLPSLHGLVGGNTRILQNVRVIRYRLYEVPAYLTLDLRKEGSDQAGYGHGVYKVNERVYYSIAQKPDSYQAPYRYSRFSSLASDGYGKNARISAPIEIVPAFLQEGDNPEYFAKAFHLLRVATSHWTNGFTNYPLPAHLAKNLTDDYVSMRSDVDVDDESYEE
jgi:hypothetical protein